MAQITGWSTTEICRKCGSKFTATKETVEKYVARAAFAFYFNCDYSEVPAEIGFRAQCPDCGEFNRIPTATIPVEIRKTA